MTVNFHHNLHPRGLLPDEDVLPPLLQWQSEGQRSALVTLIDIEGGAPRHRGAQMAVSEDGRFAGYLSGGCLESAVVLEAQAVMSSGTNRLIRFGRGSPYFDIKLPCGSGLDLYFDQALKPEHVSEVIGSRQRRQPVALSTVLSTGVSTVSTLDAGCPVAPSRRDGDLFTRTYTPHLRLVLLGNGPALIGTATLAAAMGVELMIVSGDDATRAGVAAAGIHAPVADPCHAETFERLDFATAAILFFHAHDEEPRLLRHLLKSNCFYIGALGNHAVHRQRLEALAALGLSPEDVARLRAPVGSIANAKSKASIAVSVLAEFMAEAMAQNLVP